MIEYILNGETINVKPEHEQHFLKNNPSATKKTSWWKGQEGLVPDELEFWKKPNQPGKPQEAGQPQKNQQVNTGSSSETGSSDSAEIYELNGKRISVAGKHKSYFLNNNPTAKKYEKTIGEKATDTFNNWWNNTFVGAAMLRGDIQAYDTGEAGNLMKKVGSGNMTMGDVQEWVKANEYKAENYKESAKMLAFQKKYFEEGATWSAFWKGLKADPAMTAELLIQSYSTMYNTFKDSEKARKETAVGAVTGFGVGSKFKKIGRFYGAMTGGMSALAAEMESSLAFGEFIQEELNERGLDFTDENIYNLLNSDEGQKIKNRAVGRGAAIGLVEAMAGGGAMLASRKALQIGAKLSPVKKGFKKTATGAATQLSAGTIGVGVEALGGGTGEILGRVIADQNMDPAEIGFEAVTGVAGAPLSVGTAMITHKNPIYKVNGARVSYKQLQDFVDTASEVDIASANIQIKNDPTGIGKRVSKIQQRNVFQTQIDPRVSGDDRNKLVDLEMQRLDLLSKQESKTNQNSLKDINKQIDEITEKYKDVDITSPDVAQRRKTRTEVKQNAIINRLGNTIKFAEDNADLVGKDLIMAESDVDAQAYHDMAVQEHNERIDGEIQKVQKSNLSVKEQNEAIQNLNNKKIKDADVKGADGFVVGDVIIINKDVASSTGQINVGAHEVLHGVVAKHIQSLSVEERTKLISGFLDVLTTEQKEYIQNIIDARNKAFNEGIDIKSDEEVLTIFSDGITKGKITFNEGVFDKIKNFIQELLRRVGIIKEFANGRQVYNFLKDYQKTVDEGGLLSKRAQRLADGGVDITETTFSRSIDTKKLSESIDQHVPKDITTNEQYLTRDPKTGLSPHDNVLIEILSKNTLDGYISQLIIRDKKLGGVTDTQTLLEDTKFELIRKIRSEYKPTLEDGGFRSLFSYIYGKREQQGYGGIAFRALGNMKKKYLQRPDAGAAPIDISTPEGKVTRQIADTEAEASIDTQDLSIVKQAKEAKQTKQQEQSLETEVEGKLVSEELKFTKETNDKINNEINKVNYDTNQPYENVKQDMMSQENPSADVRSEVKPTGILFKSFEIIAKDVFGVDAKSTMARKQNLSKLENESARKVIADGAKKNKSIKKFLEDILPDTNFNPKSKKSLGTWSGLIRALYEPVLKDGKQIRYNNIVARKLNLDKFTEAEVADMFGLTPEYELLPWKKGFKDGMIKGVVVGAAGLSINQSIRKVADAPASPISIGKPETAFSRSVEEGFYMDHNDLAKHWSKKTGVPVDRLLKFTKYTGKKALYDGVFNEETGETVLQAKIRFTRDFLKKYPQWRDYLMRSGFGGMSRSTYGTIAMFEALFPPNKNEIKLIRYKYLVDKKQKSKNINLTKEQQAIENKKLDNLKKYFMAIEEFIKETPEAAALFVSFYQDGGAAGMGSTVRVSFPYRIYTIDQRTRKPNFTDPMREEHNHPANQIHSALLFAAMEGNVKETFDGTRASVMQGSITLDADDLVNKGAKNIYGEKLNLTSAAPEVWFKKILPRILSGKLKLADGMGAVVRLAIQGVNLNELMIVGENQTIAEYFGVGLDIKNLTDAQIESLVPIQNDLIIKQMTGEVTKQDATNDIKKLSKIKNKSTLQQIKNSRNIVKAFDNRSNFSRSEKEVGMSIFDFDDTLGFTKSGVRATIPNPDNTPKPKRKVIFLAGGAGSGKGNVIRQLGLERMGFKIVNSDISLEWLKKNSGLPADMRDLTKQQRSTLGKLGAQARKIARGKMMKYQGNANGVVVDGTGGSVKSMQKLVDEFKSKGYDVSMLFVDTSLDVALERNRARQERSLLDVIVKRNHESVQNNKSTFKNIFGNRFMEVNTDNLTMTSPMPSKLVNQMQDFVNSYEKVRLDAAEFAEQGDTILEQGGTFDFSEFNDVVDGTPGPLLDKARQRIDKFGNKDVFVLTARPSASEQAIQQFLKSQGVNIPVENITGLGNSTGEAKASWVLEKFAEGYNNIYFADDAIQNVDAVKKVLDQLDIKSDVVQAKTKFSKSASDQFNAIIEESQGTSRSRTFSYQEAKKMGRNKGWFRIFVPPSAEDFKGLLYRFLGTGRKGDRHMEFFKTNLLDPFAKGIRAWNIYKQEMVNEYKTLKKSLPEVTKSLTKKVRGTGFTVDDAIRVFLWDRAGIEVPGLDLQTKNKLIDYVNKNTEVKVFAYNLSNISKVKEGYVAPDTNWSLGSISTDLNNAVNKIGRKQFLQEYLDNVQAIFTPENMNKIEALYGTNFKEALDNILFRMENGGNRRMSTDRNVNRMYNWINGSIGAIMFFNMRSALLQTISSVNFINWNDNNIFKASAAFANQPQFWKDFAMLFNSPQLKQRRAGIQIDVSASELSRAFADGKGTPQTLISYLLEKGFTPTQIADSTAIAFGGASFFRNRLKTYLKQGLSEQQAKEKAMLDFQEIAEETQQSSREDLVSMQQAGPLGRLILAFQNVTMQYTRLTKKALADLIYGRGDIKTNISKIVYYGVAQNIIFASLQSALAFIMWGDDEEEIENRTTRTLNSALDSFLRGTGIYGAIISTVKNTIIQAEKQKKKGWGREDGRTLLEIVNLSPPIGSKLRKIYNAIKTEQYNKGVSEELGLRIENPTIYKWASVIEALTNIPTQRLVKKANNLEEAITGNHEAWQRIMLGLGWSKWDIDVKDEELEAAKKRAKSKRNKNKQKDSKKEKVKRVRCIATKKSGGRCKNQTKNKSKKCYAHQ